MKESKYLAFLLFYRELNQKFSYIYFLTTKNEILPLLIDNRDLPRNIKIGEKWKITTKNFRDTFIKWVWGEKKENSKFDQNRWILSINHWIQQIVSTQKINFNFFASYQNLKYLNKQFINSNLLFVKISILFLKIMGQNLTLNVCIVCKNNIIYGINLDAGGAFCQKCGKEEKILLLKNNVLQILAKCVENDWWKLDLNNTMPIVSWLIAEFIDERCGFYHKIKWKKPCIINAL